jgi:hypothetical protein
MILIKVSEVGLQNHRRTRLAVTEVERLVPSLG